MSEWCWVPRNAVFAIHDERLAEHGGLDGIRADSHFWFWPQSILAMGASESGNHLTAAISGLARLPINNPTLFAQIVTNNPAAVSYEIYFDLGAAAPHYRGFLPVPEPHSFILTAGLFPLAIGHRRRG